MATGGGPETGLRSFRLQGVRHLRSAKDWSEDRWPKLFRAVRSLACALFLLVMLGALRGKDRSWEWLAQLLSCRKRLAPHRCSDVVVPRVVVRGWKAAWFWIAQRPQGNEVLLSMSEGELDQFGKQELDT